MEVTPSNSQMLRTERLICLKNARSKSTKFVREQYLRTDIPCRSVLCPGECQTDELDGNKSSLLPEDVTHYIVPCADVVGRYLEILECPEFTGIIFLQTAVSRVLNEYGRRLYGRICAKVRDVSARCIFFPDEFNFYTYSAREQGETQDHAQAKNVYNSALWYYNHLNNKIPIVMITENPLVVEEFCNITMGLYVIPFGEYLKMFWPALTSIQEIYFSLAAALENASSSGGKEYTEYLPAEVLSAGIKSGRYVQGKLNVNKHHAQLEAFVTRTLSTIHSKMGTETDVLVSGMKHRNRAVHGDVVVVELLLRAEWSGRIRALREHTEDDSMEGEDGVNCREVMPTGRVVGVIQRCWRDYVVSFPRDQDLPTLRKSGEAILAIPYDYRIPKIRIVTRQAEKLKNERLVVRIDNWNIDSQYPNGHFVRSLGEAGDLETEIASLLVENGITTAPFSGRILSELPVNTEEEPWFMNEEEIGRRRDLRTSHLIYSIDPQGCEDVDDTLSVKELPDGTLELGVHIADVTYFVAQDSATDIEARSRGTTFYLADRRFDMLPSVLNSDLCSLLGSADRYAVSVMWKLGQDFQVLDIWYGRTVIRSSYKLAYETAQSIIDGSSCQQVQDVIPELHLLEGHALEERFCVLRDSLLKLREIADTLKIRRLKEGALELESVEVEFEFGNSNVKGHVECLKPKEHLEVHETVAECMIFTNHWVAKKIHASFPHQSLLRCHPAPRLEQFRELKLCAEAAGFDIATESSRSLADSLNSADDTKDAYVNKILRMLATHSMSNAVYFSSGCRLTAEYFHYGLGLDRYTHFTSPIRRYADVLVHRLLLAAVDSNCGADLHSCLLGTESLNEICEHINVQHKASKKIQKESQQLFQTFFFKDKQDDDDCCVVDAIIFSLRANGVLVYVPRYAIKGPVYLRNKEKQVAYVHDSKVEWIAGSLVQETHFVSVRSVVGVQDYRFFEHITVRVQLVHSHAHPNTLRFELVDKKPWARDFEGCEQQVHHYKHSDLVREVKLSYSGQDDTVNIEDTVNKEKESDKLYFVIQALWDLSLQSC